MKLPDKDAENYKKQNPNKNSKRPQNLKILNLNPTTNHTKFKHPPTNLLPSLSPSMSNTRPIPMLQIFKNSKQNIRSPPIPNIQKNTPRNPYKNQTNFITRTTKYIKRSNY